MICFENEHIDNNLILLFITLKGGSNYDVSDIICTYTIHSYQWSSWMFFHVYVTCQYNILVNIKEGCNL